GVVSVQRVYRAERPECSVVARDETTIFGADPQPAFAIREHRGEPVRVESGRMRMVEYGEADPVVADEAVTGCQPQVSIRRLRDADDRNLGQAVVRIPALESILRPSLRRGYGQEANDKNQTRCDGDTGGCLDLVRDETHAITHG